MNSKTAFKAGLEFQRAGNYAEAEKQFRLAVSQDRNNAMNMINLGVALFSLGRLTEAKTIQERAISLAPRNAVSYNNLGVTLNTMGLHREAIAMQKRAIELDPSYHHAMNNLADAFNQLGFYQEAIGALRRALEFSPTFAEANNNMGVALIGLGEISEAVKWFSYALEYNPNMTAARKNRGLAYLFLGQWKDGWTDSDWRWAHTRGLQPGVLSSRPRWRGQHLNGLKLLVWGEQGVGDEILSAHMAADAAAMGNPIIWACDPRLLNLFQKSYPQIKFVPKDSFETHDFGIAAQIPGISMGEFLRLTPQQIACHPDGFLRYDLARASEFRRKVALLPGEKLVGVSWHSIASGLNSGKGTKLSEWSQILSTPGFRFVDLQYGDTTAERSEVANLLHLEDLDLKNDLDGVAALMGACDLIITVSNTAAHLAAAIGRPTWVMAPKGTSQFWHWGHEGPTTLWYGTATVFRQAVRGKWEGVLRDVAARLLTF